METNTHRNIVLKIFSTRHLFMTDLKSKQKITSEPTIRKTPSGGNANGTEGAALISAIFDFFAKRLSFGAQSG